MLLRKLRVTYILFLECLPLETKLEGLYQRVTLVSLNLLVVILDKRLDNHAPRVFYQLVLKGKFGLATFLTKEIVILIQ